MIAASVCLAGLLGAGAPPTSGSPEEIPSSSVLQVPGLGLGPQDDIDAVDFAVAADDSLHAVWRAVVRRAGSAPPDYSVHYLRREAEGKWGRQFTVTDSVAEPPRIVLTPGRDWPVVHVLLGPKLRHFVGDGRGPFRELAPLVTAGRARVVAFDAVSFGNDLRVGYLLDLPAHEETPGALELHVTGGALADRMITRFPPSVLRQAPPRLLAEGGRLRLLCAINSVERSTATSGGRKVEEVAAAGRVFLLSSGDGGATWTPPAEVGPGRLAPAIVQIELIARPGAFVAVYSAFGLRASRSADGRTWSAPVVIAPYSTSLSRGSTESGAVAAVSGADGVLTWIDARFRGSDRRWWNPLGGVPWSDEDPLWANNDVFILGLPDLDAVLAGRRVIPRRLTPPLSFAYGLRARAASGGRAVLMWAGRSKVGKQPSTFHQPPTLFYVTLRSPKR